MRVYTERNGGVQAVADYLASLQAQGWPGSRSIHGRLVQFIRRAPEELRKGE